MEDVPPDPKLEQHASIKAGAHEKAQGTRPSCKEWLRGSGGDFYYHMYWRGPMKRVVRMAIFSFLHTQACGKLILWVEGDGRDKHGYYRGLMTLPKQRFEIRQVDLKFLACRWDSRA